MYLINQNNAERIERNEGGELIYDLETGKMFNEPASSSRGDSLLPESEWYLLNEPELMSMRGRPKNVLHKNSGKFDISTTQHDHNVDRFGIKQMRNPHFHIFFPKNKEHKSNGRPRTRGVFNGTKVAHPCYKNASIRYRSRSKVTDLVKNEFSALNTTPMEAEAIVSKEFKNKPINFINPQGLHDLYLFSGTSSPKENVSKRALTAKLFGNRVPNRKINQNIKSPKNDKRK